MKNITTRGFKPNSYDQATRSFVATVATETPAQVWDWERFDVIHEVLLMRGATWPEIGQAPLLDSHARDSTRHILGSARNFRIDGDQLLADVFLADGATGEAIGHKIAGGHLTDLSIGYQVQEGHFIPDGQVQTIDGREFAGPVKVVTLWEIKEVSLTPIGADKKAKIRSMPEKTRSLPTMQQIQNAPDQDQAQTRNADDAVQAERQRVSEITDICAQAGLMEYAKRFVADGSSPDVARRAVFDHLTRTAPQPMGDRRIDVDMGATDTEKREAAILDALCVRAGVRPEKPAPGHEQFRGMTLHDLARNTLESLGTNTRGLTRSEVMSKALTTRSMNTTSDYPLLLSNLTGKVLRESYKAAPQTFKEWTSEGQVSDFKLQHRLILSEAADLKPVAEGAEYEFSSFNEGGETFTVGKIGRIFRCSWEQLVNDDLGAFSRVARAFSMAAARNLNATVYNVLTGNPVMADTEQLFSVAHANIAEAGGALSIESLSEARRSMRRQKGLNSDYPLGISPEILIVPSALETAAYQLIETAGGYDPEGGFGTQNPFYRRMKIVVDPVLDDSSESAWFVAANPAQFDTVEVSYLDGRTQPWVDEQTEFEVDAFSTKIRFVFGVCPLDFRGLYMNEGDSGEE